MDLKIGDKVSVEMRGDKVELFLVSHRDSYLPTRGYYSFVFPNKEMSKRYKNFCTQGVVTSGTVFPDECYHTTRNECFNISAEYLDKITFIKHDCQEYKDFVNRHKAWFDTTKKKCSICGKKVCSTSIVISNNKKNICKSCLFVKPYGYKNYFSFGAPTKSRARYGFELECVSRNKKGKDIVEVLSMNRGLIPTNDASLPRNGVEFKTPILNNLRGAKKMLETMSKYWDFQNNKCGQHINISIPEFTEDIRRFIIVNPAPLNEFADYMTSHAEQTKVVCGRYFTDYAGNLCDYTHHCNWLNLSHSGRAEFRLSKIAAPAQYILLAKMWTEILYCCVNYYNEYNHALVQQYRIDELSDIVTKYSNKMIKTFNKYYSKISKMT